MRMSITYSGDKCYQSFYAWTVFYPECFLWFIAENFFYCVLDSVIDSLWCYLCLHAHIIHLLFQVFHLCFVHILFVFCTI